LLFYYLKYHVKRLVYKLKSKVLMRFVRVLRKHES
jgi:hypothetical protein